LEQGIGEGENPVTWRIAAARCVLTESGCLGLQLEMGALKLHRDGDRLLQLLVFNEECLVGASHQLAPITSLPFVHTARRSYRLIVLVKCLDWLRSVATLVRVEKIIKPSRLEEGEVVTRFP